jgi:hypothetical protein
MMRGWCGTSGFLPDLGRLTCRSTGWCLGRYEVREEGVTRLWLSGRTEGRREEEERYSKYIDDRGAERARTDQRTDQGQRARRSEEERGARREVLARSLRPGPTLLH